MPEVMDWDAAYRNEIFAGPPPWNIGDAQPEIVTLIEAGKLVSPVLDVGCGVGDNSLELAARGYDVVGIDEYLRVIHRAAAPERFAADAGVHDGRPTRRFAVPRAQSGHQG